MQAAELTAICESAIATAVLLILFLKLVPSYRTDAFRQRMFALRDEMFDYASSGKVSFNDPAYKLLRQLMNGYIRYAHHLTFFRMCVTVAWWKIDQQPPPNWANAWAQALTNVKDEDTREALRIFHSRAQFFMAERIVLGSPVLLAAFAVTLLATVLQTQWRDLKQIISETMARAIDPALVEEEAVRATARA